MPTVSVIIPTYNSARFLAEALESVKRQTFADWEIVVVDDGSTDDTQAVLARYSGDIVALHQANGGAAPARNAALAVAQGEFVALLDADDVWAPTKLERQLALFEGRPRLGLVFADAVTFNAQGVLSASWLARKPKAGGWTFEKLLWHNFICASTVVARRECFSRVGAFDSEAGTVEDRDMWLRIAAEYELECLPEPLTWWRFHDSNTMWDRERALTCLARVLRKARRLYPKRVRRAGAQPRRALAEAEFDLGYWYFERGRLAEARARFQASAGEWPWAGRRYVYWLASLLPPGQVAALRSGWARLRRAGRCRHGSGKPVARCGMS